MLDLKGNKIIYFGHSTFGLSTPGGQFAIIDPFVMSNPRCPENLKKLMEGKGGLEPECLHADAPATCHHTRHCHPATESRKLESGEIARRKQAPLNILDNPLGRASQKCYAKVTFFKNYLGLHL